MKQRKDPGQGKKILWRMNQAAPQGEFVISDAAATKLPEAPKVPVPVAREVSHGSWLESSFELLNGTEVREGPDTVPDDLFDELFPKR